MIDRIEKKNNNVFRIAIANNERTKQSHGLAARRPPASGSSVEYMYGA
jgi:hypothetical protein